MECSVYIVSAFTPIPIHLRLKQKNSTNAFEESCLDQFNNTPKTFPLWLQKRGPIVPDLTVNQLNNATVGSMNIGLQSIVFSFHSRSL